METRIRMLNVTYMRYIDQHLICFVPGKVLDEIKRLLRLIESRFNPPNNNNQLLEELRDLSSMAMEHFDEHVLPLLEKKEKVTLFKNAMILNPDFEENGKTLKELKKLHKRNRLFKTQVNYLASKIRRVIDKCNRQNTRIKKQSSIIKEQNAKLKVQATRLENHEIVITEMRKKIEEMQNNFIEVKTKWEMDSPQKKAGITSTTDPSCNMVSPVDKYSMTRNLKRLMQQESFRQKNNVLKKLCSRSSTENRTALNKPQFTSAQRDEKKRKCMNMIDLEIWRRRCPSSRMTYVTYKNNLKNRTEILLNRNHNLNEPCQSVRPDDEKTKHSNFVHKTIIKQRASRIFPLSCLDLDRKRKSHLYSDIPSKLTKTEQNSMKAIDLINVYLPASKQAKEKQNENLSNIISYLESHPSKRKRDENDDA